MESCGMNFIKYCLFIFNFIFALAGLIIIVSGSVVLANTSNYNKFLDPAIVTSCIVLIVIGALVFLIASVGCIGAIRESYCLLMTFAVFLLIIFLIEIAIGTATAIYQDNLIQGLNDSIKNYATLEEDKNSWDAVHKEFKCCGTNGPISWQGQNVPHSCCHDDTTSTNLSKYCTDNGAGKFMYEEGCLDKLKAEMNSNWKILLGVGGGVAFVEIAGIILSCWMAFTIKKEVQDK